METFAGVVVASCAAGVLIVTAVGALAVQVLRNARDIQAAWAALRDHERRLNGSHPQVIHREPTVIHSPPPEAKG